MSDLIIEGGVKLNGEVTIQGSKNAVLPMMAASVLCKGESILRNCPKISDVFYMEEILQSLGASSRWENNDLYLDCTNVNGTEIPQFYSKKMRSSVILLGVLLSRNKTVQMGYPGGCIIGKRPIDMHIWLLRKMGAEIRENTDSIYGNGKLLHGVRLRFRRKSVGATEQAILTAVMIKGESILENCAVEPEVKWLCIYLQKMGAEIDGVGTEKLFIKGVSDLKGGDIQVPADRIVAGTYMSAVAITRGEAVFNRVPLEELRSFLRIYRKIGGQYEERGGKLIVNGRGISLPINFLETEAYPGFPTDLQSPLMAVLATIKGRSCICENIFEGRFRIAEELLKMGAHIELKNRCAFIEGGYPLMGCEVDAKELRGGAALILAALAAEGKTYLNGYTFIKRGYEDICRDLCDLGGKIKKDTGID